jgi:outer membrane immunogenic protein
MKKFPLGVLAGAAIMATPVIAADLPRPVTKAPPPPVVAAYNWTGFYIGGNCGGAWGRTTSSSNDGGFDPVGVSALSYKVDSSGGTCGGQVGYNWQAGSLVLGVEGEGAWLGLKKTITGSGPDVTSANVDDLVAVKFDWYAALTGRLGIAVDRVLLYAKGGVAWTRVKNTASDLDGSPLVIDPTDFSSESRSRTGWAAGGGLEYGLTPNWSVKAEYLFLDFGRYTTGVNGDGDVFVHKNEVHTAKFGINYRFGGPVAARY